MEVHSTRPVAPNNTFVAASAALTATKSIAVESVSLHGGSSGGGSGGSIGSSSSSIAIGVTGRQPLILMDPKTCQELASRGVHEEDAEILKIQNIVIEWISSGTSLSTSVANILGRSPIHFYALLLT